MKRNKNISPVADQGFPRAGYQHQWGGKGALAYLLLGIIFAQSCIKMKKNIGLRGVVASGSATVHHVLQQLLIATTAQLSLSAFLILICTSCSNHHGSHLFCRAIKTKGMVFRYIWVYSKEDTMAHTYRPMVTS